MQACLQCRHGLGLGSQGDFGDWSDQVRAICVSRDWQLLHKPGMVLVQVVPMAREFPVGQRWKEAGPSWSWLNTYNKQNIFSDDWQGPVKLMVAQETTVPTRSSYP